ncbi:indole-3-pyruvate monooxygenase [Ranunculus cassubicifolius]
MEDKMVIIVGAGPAGIATSACLNRLSIPNQLIEKEDCSAFSWKKKCYDRMHLKLPKYICQLPYMPFPKQVPTYVPKEQFIQYMDEYVEKFQVKPLYNRSAESAKFDGKWHVKVKNITSDQVDVYSAKFLVIATGANCDKYLPEIDGVQSFSGQLLHSSEYKSGEVYRDKSVLVVGCGNSGMEIALDLANFGAKTSLVVRNPMHILNKEIVHIALILSKYLPLSWLDAVIVFLCKAMFGDTAKYGIVRPKEGPFSNKVKYGIGRFPVIDVGTFDKIRSGEIQVTPAIQTICGNAVNFANGKTHQFDVIVFATGFTPSFNKWLENNEGSLVEDGILKKKNNWKQENCMYMVGAEAKGVGQYSPTSLPGIAMDAQKVADDIKDLI